ncbi:MAG: hypothetical protein D6689_14295 [Deltaproteobacteria bacterium]|nr:MAG: hypothetical protein D6689_14295 [Deltaproteobacteria bacterium]
MPGDIAPLYAPIRRARRRLRLRSALEAATTASILAAAIAMVTMYLARRDAIGTSWAIAMGMTAGALVVGAAVWGAARRLPDPFVAAKIDRACGLHDRLGTAIDFARRLQRGDVVDPDTRAFMEAAIADAMRHLPNADPAKATPFAIPRDARAAVVFAAATAAVALLAFPRPGPWQICAGGRCASLAELDRLMPDPGAAPDDPVELDDDDVLYTEELLADLRRTAEQTRDPHLEAFVDEVEALLARAKAGQIGKQELLKQLAAKEREYLRGADEDLDPVLSELEKTGRELQKNELTRELGKALERRDLAKAEREFDKLADKLANDELSDRQRQQLAKALERAADQFDKRQRARDQKADRQLERARRDVRRLQRRLARETDPQRREAIARRLRQKQRELKRLERDKQQREQSASQRRLKRLHRNLRNAARDMRRDDAPSRRTLSSRRMKDLARDTGRVDADRRKLANQRKVATQMGDLKEALRRARRRGGMNSKFGKNRRNQDFRARARGGRGRRDAWRPAQPGGPLRSDSRWGDEDGGNPLGDPTPRTGDVKDEQLSGVHGRGPSVRETIITAAQKGFASRAYEKVYASYKAVIEEVMRTEKVPSGYKYYVKRYFQKIKPPSPESVD